MGLSIHTTNIQLGIERIPSRMQMETQNAKLELHQKPAKLSITSEKPKVLIDQYECFAEEGLKSTGDLLKEAAQLGYQQAMDFIGKTAADGNILAAIENGGNPIKDIAVRDSSPEKSFGMVCMPRSRPKIDVTGSLDMQWDWDQKGARNGVEMEYTPGNVNINFVPGKINISVLQYPSVNVRYEPNIDVSI